MKPYGAQTWDTQIKNAEDALSSVKLQRSQWEHVEPEFPCRLVTGTSSRLIIFDIDDLPQARALMRHVFGSWNDTLGNRWYSCGMAITSWHSKDQDCQIWLECKVDDYPAELAGEHCKWIERGQKDYAFVCERGEG